MFLHRVEELGYLQPRLDSGSFLHFPPAVRKSIGGQTVQYLLTLDPNDNQIFNSHETISSYMEIIGQSFGLTMDASTVIENAAEFYRRWLLESRPALVEERKLYYVLEMVRHISFLFSPREPSDNVQAHEALATTVIAILNDVTDVYEKEFELEQWTEYLMLILGMCDCILNNPNEIGNRLAFKLMRLLLLSFVKSQLDDEYLWGNMMDLFPTWTHRMPIIRQWGKWIKEYTDRVIDLLYHEEKYVDLWNIKITMELDTNTDEVVLDSEHIYFIWYRLLYILGDLETIQDRNIYNEAMKCVRELTSKYLAIKDDLVKDNAAPDGNTILHLFGPFLFESVNKVRPGFDTGICECFHALFNIFLSKPDTTYLPKYYALFYRGIALGLQYSNQALDVILVNSIHVFQLEFPGYNLLISHYLYAINQILSTYLKGGDMIPGIQSPPEKLRYALYKIFQYIITVKNIYGDEPIYVPENAPAEFQLSFRSFKSLKKVDDSLINILKIETDEENLITLIWLLIMFIQEEVVANPEFPNLFAKAIMLKMRIWSPIVLETSLRALSHLAEVYERVYSEASDLGPWLVKNLCGFLEKLIKTKPLNEAVVITVYHCIEKWCCVGNWIFEPISPSGKPPIVARVLQLITIGMTGQMGHTTEQAWKRDDGKRVPIPDSTVHYFIPTANITSTARRVLTSILQRGGKYPLILGPSIISSLDRESQILNYYGLDESHLNVYVFDSTLFSIFRLPRDVETGNISVTVLMRNYSGSYIWNMDLNYFIDYSEAISKYEHTTNGNDPTMRRPVETLSEDIDKTLWEYLKGDEVEKNTFLSQIIQDRIAQEEKMPVRDLEKITQFISPPVPTELPELDTVGLRIFVSTIGIGNPMNRHRIRVIKDSNTGAMDLNIFAGIDAIPERVFQTVGIVHVGNALSEEEAYLSPGSEKFNHFISKLGWEVDLSVHKGFFGKHRMTGETGIVSRYYADRNTEVMCHVSTMIPSVDVAKHIISSDAILIIWKSYKEDIPDTLLETTASTIITITELPTGLFKIQKSSQDALSGPIFDNCVATTYSLSTIVMQACLSQATFNSGDFPMERRLQEIIRVREAHSNPVNFSEFYSGLFVHDSS